jgi:RHS repeat-associated protein
MHGIPLRGSVVLTLLPVLLIVSSKAVQGEIRLHVGGKAPSSAQDKWYYYHSNHLGSVHVVTDGDSNVVARRSYRPYGEPFEWSGHVKGPQELMLTFDGQRYDDEEQLYYFNARHYDPVMGRFLASDTKVPDPTDPRSLHRYAFGAGNPIRYVDPTGHGFWDWFVAIFVIVIAAVIAVVTFGAGLALGFACLGGILLMTVGAAFAGGVVFASLALSRGTDPLSADFWKAAAAGMIIGAAVGAGFACLPSALATFGSLASGFTGILASLGANAMVGAAFGAVQETIVHFKTGGGPEGLLTAKLGIAIGISAAISMVSTGVLGPLKQVEKIAKVVKAISGLMKAGAVGGLVHAGFTGKTVMQSLGDSVEAGMQAFVNLTIYGIAHNAASPGRSPGIPVWAFAGATLGGGGGAGDSEMSAIFATMPLAP